MLLCHSCYIYGTWKSKDGGGLKSSYRGKLEGKGNHEVKGGGHVLLEVDLSAILSELPTYFSLFWCKNSSMICTR